MKEGHSLIQYALSFRLKDARQSQECRGHHTVRMPRHRNTAHKGEHILVARFRSLKVTDEAATRRKQHRELAKQREEKPWRKGNNKVMGEERRKANEPIAGSWSMCSYSLAFMTSWRVNTRPSGCRSRLEYVTDTCAQVRVGERCAHAVAHKNIPNERTRTRRTTAHGRKRSRQFITCPIGSSAAEPGESSVKTKADYVNDQKMQEIPSTMQYLAGKMHVSGTVELARASIVNRVSSSVLGPPCACLIY